LEKYFSICIAKIGPIWKTIPAITGNAPMGFLPSLSALGGHTVLLVGSGPIAAAALHDLVDAGASVRWFSRSVDVAEDIWLQRKTGLVEITFRELKPSDLIDVFAVVAAVGEPLARCVAEQARAVGCPIHVIGRPDLSTLHLDDQSGLDDQPGQGGDTVPLLSPLQRAGHWLSAQLGLSAQLVVTQGHWRNASSREGATAHPTR
jgi:Putative NAD(P)-binding